MWQDTDEVIDMGASDDDDEYIVYGRPLQEERESFKGQYSKEAQDKASTRALPVWQQEVTDEQGRRRLHGAFTGGYSAGFFNTVGSKEGWAPSTFRSSRGQRSDARHSTAEDFMDEDELQELRKDVVQTGQGYDTFGHAAADQSRKAALSEQAQRPGLAHLDLSSIIAPVPESIGIKLLQKMGWRPGKGIGKQSSRQKLQSGTKWGPMRGVSVENTQIQKLTRKDDTHGLGYDPFQGAEDFRNAKRHREAPPPESRLAKRRGPGVAFGTGIMDEDDVFGLADDYVVEPDAKEGYNFDLHSDEEGGSPRGAVRMLDSAYMLPGVAEPLKLYSKEKAAERKYDLIPGFTRAQAVERTKQYPPPKLPKGYKPVKVYPERPPEPVGLEPPAPRPEVLDAIKSVAPYVANLGTAFETLALQHNAVLPAFSFLMGGEGHEYYKWQIRALKAAKRDTSGLSIGQRTRPLSVGERGLLLGEGTPSSTLHQADTALKTLRVTEIADGDRQALQQTLQSTFARGRRQDMGMSNEVQQGSYGLRPGKPPATAQQILAAAGSKFASAGTLDLSEQAVGGLSMRKEKKSTSPPRQAAKPKPPRRTVEEWRPAPLLCKRFNVPDPFRGQAGPATEGPKFRTDQLALPETAAASHLPLSHLALTQMGTSDANLPPPPLRKQEVSQVAPQTANAAENPEPRTKPGDEATEFLDSLLGLGPALPGPPPSQIIADKPEKLIDLFKAIFEDDSDDSDSQQDEVQHESVERPVAELQPGQQVAVERSLVDADASSLSAQRPIIFKPRDKDLVLSSQQSPLATEADLSKTGTEAYGQHNQEALAAAREARKADKKRRKLKKDKKEKDEKGDKKGKKAKKDKGHKSAVSHRD